jgi:hypothetical protein
MFAGTEYVPKREIFVDQTTQRQVEQGLMVFKFGGDFVALLSSEKTVRYEEGEVLVFLRSVLDAHEHCLAIHVGIPGEMISLTGSGAQIDMLRLQLLAQSLAQQFLHHNVRLAARLCAMKGSRAITSPVVDVVAAHDQDSGV